MEDEERSGQQSSPSLGDFLRAVTQPQGGVAAPVKNSTTRVVDIPLENHFGSLRITDPPSPKGVRAVPPAVEAQLQAVQLDQSTHLKQGWNAPLAMENDERCGSWTSHGRNDVKLCASSLSPLGVRQLQVSKGSSTRGLQGSNSLVTKSDHVSDDKPSGSLVPGARARSDLQHDMLFTPSTIGPRQAEQPSQPSLHEHGVGEQDPTRNGFSQFQEKTDDSVACSSMSSIHYHDQHYGRVPVPAPGERSDSDIEVHRLQHGHDVDSLASEDALFARRQDLGSPRLIYRPPRSPQHKHLIDGDVGAVGVEQSPPGHMKSRRRSGARATTAEEPTRDRGRNDPSLHNSNRQRPRNGTSTSIKDDLNDALSILLRDDNQERFRRERTKERAEVTGSHGVSGVSSTAQRGERGGPGMRWIKGGFLPSSNHEKPLSAAGPSPTTEDRRREEGDVSYGGPGQGVPIGRGEGQSHGMGEAAEERLVGDNARKPERRSVASGAGEGEPHATPSAQRNRENGAPQRYSMRGAATAPWERHTKGFGSRILRKMGFNGTTGGRETELVTTFATEAMASREARDGERGGLGHVCSIERDRGGHCPSAPSDMDFGRRKSDPSPAYSGVTVHFPFDAPMKPQGQLMQRVIAALKNKKHALLESPTGTGKSTALLCSTLAWQVIYGARTHTQLSQMVGELKKCPYRPTMAILGSRQQLCIHPDVAGAGPGMEEEDERYEGLIDDFESLSLLNRDDLDLRRAPRELGIETRPRDPGEGGRASCDGTALSGSGDNRRGAQRKRFRRSRRSMQDTCLALRSKDIWTWYLGYIMDVRTGSHGQLALGPDDEFARGPVEDQRKTNQMPVLLRDGEESAREEGMPPGVVGRAPYDDKRPNLRVDFAAIDGRLRDSQRQMAGCPFYRAMSMPEYAHLTHELARPAVGLERGADGIWDLEDLRGFCRDPRGFMNRKRDERSTALAGRDNNAVGHGRDPVEGQEVSSPSSSGSPKRQASPHDPQSVGHAVESERSASPPGQPHPQGPPLSPEVRGGRHRDADVSDAGCEVGSCGRRCEGTRGGADQVSPGNTGESKARCGDGGKAGSDGMSPSTATVPGRPCSKEVIHLSYDEDDARYSGEGVPGVAHVASAEPPSPGCHGSPVEVTPADSTGSGSPTSLAAGAVIASAMEGGEGPGKGSRCGVGETGDSVADPSGARTSQALGCPYFTAKALAVQAQLVLVPYNYIMDPQVRKALTVPLAGNVIVLDEAHNIESVCRDAGSLELPVTALSHLTTSLCHLAATEELYMKFTIAWSSALKQALSPFENHDSFSCSAHFLLSFVKHLTEFVARESNTFGDLRSGKTFDRPRGTPEEERKLKGDQGSVQQRWAFDSAGRNFWSDLVAGQDQFGHHALTAAFEDLQTAMRELNRRSDLSLGYLETFLMVTEMMLRRPHDYSITIIAWENVLRMPLGARCRHRPSECHLREWALFQELAGPPSRLFQLNLWLMAPDVVFDDVAQQAHSVILTSGTLSPLDSFRGELGRAFDKDLLPFPQQALEANHVVTPGRQLEVLAVDSSPPPNFFDLRCTKGKLDDEDFMREVGRTVARLCRHVPSGVLVFLPSYSRLREAVSAWRRSEVWADLLRLKGTIVEEPDSSAEFQVAKRQYEAAIEAPGGGHALLLAVYRGKMSEGISFNDDYARGVFCVGIPYPSIADPKVVAKKRYNNWKADTTGWAREDPLTYRGRGGVRRWRDIVCDARDAVGRSGGGGSGDGSGGSRGGLAGVAEADANAVFGGNRRTLSGDEWYGHQAFRALNQALGRCIRHINDYGVICLIDSRHRIPSRFLARWMRELIRCMRDQEAMEKKIDQLFQDAPSFVEGRRAEKSKTRRVGTEGERYRRRLEEAERKGTGSVSSPAEGSPMRDVSLRDNANDDCSDKTSLDHVDRPSAPPGILIDHTRD